MTTQKIAIGVLPKQENIQQAIESLKASGFPIDQVSVLAKQVDEDQEPKGVEISEHLEKETVETPAEAVQATATEVVKKVSDVALWGGLLIGSTSLAIPGVGMVIAAGSLGAVLLGSLAKTGISTIEIHNLIHAITELGVPEETARGYSDRFVQGDYLTIVQGSDAELDRAEVVLSDRGLQHWETYAATPV